MQTDSDHSFTRQGEVYPRKSHSEIPKQAESLLEDQKMRRSKSLSTLPGKGNEFQHDSNSQRDNRNTWIDQKSDRSLSFDQKRDRSQSFDRRGERNTLTVRKPSQGLDKQDASTHESKSNIPSSEALSSSKSGESISSSKGSMQRDRQSKFQAKSLLSYLPNLPSLRTLGIASFFFLFVSVPYLLRVMVMDPLKRGEEPSGHTLPTILERLQNGKEIAISREMLWNFNCHTKLPYILLSFKGDIYDATKNEMFSKDGPYSYFTGRDATRSMVTGCVQPGCRSDLRGLTKEEMENIDEWKEVLDSTMKKVGKLKYYNSEEVYYSTDRS